MEGIAMFGHQKLRVYEKSLQFVSTSDVLLRAVPRTVAACDHLCRASESLPLNIAHANSAWSPPERIVYLGHANGSALECAACLDIMVAKLLLPGGAVLAGKGLLREIVNMLVAMKNVTSERVREDRDTADKTDDGRFFSHERLHVYQVSVSFTGWVETASRAFACSADLLAKLDKASTGIVLNIAEGNGRFSDCDHARFLGIAHKAAVQSSALLDLATLRSAHARERAQQGQELLERVVAMLVALARKVSPYA